MKKWILWVLLLGLVANSVTAQSKSQLRRMEQANRIKEVFDGRNFETFVDQALYSDRAPYALSDLDSYYIKVEGDSLYCNIPYLGQMSGLNIPNAGTFFTFAAKINYYKTETIDIKAKVTCQVVSGDNITYTIGIETEYNGLTILNIIVASQNALYEGRLNKKR